MPQGKTEIKLSRSKIIVDVPVATWKEGDSHIVYCPALEISAYGDNPDEAVHSFKVNLRIFFRHTIEKGTLERILLGLGWTLQQKPKPRYQPPKVSKHVIVRRPGMGPKSIRNERIEIPFTVAPPRPVEAGCD